MFPQKECHLQCVQLGDGFEFFVGNLSEALIKTSTDNFEALWALHPTSYDDRDMFGRSVLLPRWQEAYGRDYKYSGKVKKAVEMSPLVQPYLDMARASIDDRLTGALLNWYDSSRGHYIGPHRDSTENMVEGTPIVTISLGAERIFRLKRWKQAGGARHDFVAHHGAVFVTPYETNLAWTHEVPRRAKDQGRRISITLRALSN